jgi:hypothetical protein
MSAGPGRRRTRHISEAYYLQRTRFESIAERKLRRRRLTEDGNVEISGRDLREGSSAAIGSRRRPAQFDPSRLRKNAVPATVLGNCYIELTPQLPQTAMQTGFLE